MQEHGGTFLEEGRNCAYIAQADRVAMIVDAADHFRHLRSAMLKARHDILLIGWDFDTRIRLVPGGEGLGAPRKLGRFLNWLARRRPELRIRILQWNLGTLQAFGRGSTPLFIANWMSSKRITFKLDAAHPVGAAHHQKIAVIDGTLAFCGGIDMTGDRWDTRDHLDDDPRRRRPTTHRRYGPWHDVSTCVTGPAAAALSAVARDRWKRATGETLDPPPPAPDIWPDGLEPSVENARTGISLTMPPYGGEPGIHQVEKLYLDAIGRARKYLYIESQYFASRRVAEAICARLAEPDPPEIVIVNPEVGERLA